MVTIPALCKLTWDFLTLPESEIQRKFLWSCYWWQLAIFVAMTNQVNIQDNKNDKIFLFTRNSSFKKFLLDSQVVAYVFWTSQVGCMVTRVQNNFATKASSCPSCCTT